MRGLTDAGVGAAGAVQPVPCTDRPEGPAADPSAAERRLVPFVLQHGLFPAGSAVPGPASALSPHSPARTGSCPSAELSGICPMTADGAQWTCMSSALGAAMCSPQPSAVLLEAWGLSDLRVTVSGEKSWVFGLGPFSDRAPWRCQRSAGSLGQCHEFARMGLRRSSSWLHSSPQCCPRGCFPSSASQYVLGFASGKKLPNPCQDSCPVV